MIQSIIMSYKQYPTQVLKYVYNVQYHWNKGSVYLRPLSYLHCVFCIQYGSRDVLEFTEDNLGENLDKDSAKEIENTGEDKD